MEIPIEFSVNLLTGYLFYAMWTVSSLLTEFCVKLSLQYVKHSKDVREPASSYYAAFFVGARDSISLVGACEM